MSVFALPLISRKDLLYRVYGELVPRPILRMTSLKAKQSPFRDAPHGRETFQSVNSGHKLKRGIVSEGCSNESSACDSERESLRYQAAIGV